MNNRIQETETQLSVKLKIWESFASERLTPPFRGGWEGSDRLTQKDD
jgi:hypothetical protein